MMRPPRTVLASLLLVLSFIGVAPAAPRLALPPGLQAAALVCAGEVMRLCPGALKAPDRGIACLRAKRLLLSAPCRGVYDQGVSFLRGGDVYLDLRALRRKGALRSRAETAALEG